MAYMVMAFRVMVYVVTAYVVMAYIVMVVEPQELVVRNELPSCAMDMCADMRMGHDHTCGHGHVYGRACTTRPAAVLRSWSRQTQAAVEFGPRSTTSPSCKM